MNGRDENNYVRAIGHSSATTKTVVMEQKLWFRNERAREVSRSGRVLAHNGQMVSTVSWPAAKKWISR